MWIGGDKLGGEWGKLWRGWWYVSGWGVNRLVLSKWICGGAGGVCGWCMD